jgi:DNA mismatch endonuclease (patch repair protein)
VPKLARNAARDRKNVRRLRAMGWSVLVVWECEVRQQERLAVKLRDFLRERGPRKLS